MKTIQILALSLVLAFLSTTVHAQRMFAKFDGVDGESMDKEHRNWSNITSFSHEMTARRSATGTARQRNASEIGDLNFDKQLDKAGPKLAEALLTGKVFPKVEIHLANSNGVYLKYELKNVMITSYQISGSEGDVPTESLSLNFEEIKVTYTETDSKGGKAGNTEYSWNVKSGGRK